MRLLILFICLLVRTSVSQSSTPGELIHGQKGNSTELNVLTWNVQMLPRIGSLFSSDLRKMQEERTDWIIEYLKNSNFDVVLLQECFDRDFIQSISKELAGEYPFQTTPRRPIWYKLSNGLMILSRHPMSIENEISFSYAAQSDVFASKGAILAKIQIDTHAIFVVNTHLQADYETRRHQAIRKKQLSEIKKNLLQGMNPTMDKLLIGGDLNVEENIVDEEYKELIETFKSRDLVYEFFKKPSSSFDRDNYWNRGSKANPCRLDYFLNNFGLLTKTIRILKTKKVYQNEEIDLADHYGIQAIFKL